MTYVEPVGSQTQLLHILRSAMTINLKGIKWNGPRTWR